MRLTTAQWDAHYAREIGPAFVAALVAERVPMERLETLAKELEKDAAPPPPDMAAMIRASRMAEGHAGDSRQERLRLILKPVPAPED